MSSAVYRYVDSREALITDLVMSSYRGLEWALAAADEVAAGEGPDWRRPARALRAWTLEHPHEFQLLYGTPIPGYAAPADTIPLAAAVASHFFAAVPPAGSRAGEWFRGARLEEQFAEIASATGVPPSPAAAVLAEMRQLVGMLGLELSGHFVGSADPADALYEAVLARQSAAFGGARLRVRGCGVGRRGGGWGVWSRSDSVGSTRGHFVNASPARSTRLPIRHALAKLFWACSRYRLVREQPRVEGRRILIGAPHTSNWDFVYMLAIAWDARLRIRWLGKHQLFVGWRGPIMRALGGVAVDRANPAGVVDAVLELARTDAEFTLVVTPEGTRSGSGWRSGFYRIARGADLPVTLGFVDSVTRTTGLGPTIRLTGDVAADMDVIRAFYADKAGVKPHLRTEPRLANEGSGVAGEGVVEGRG